MYLCIFSPPPIHFHFFCPPSIRLFSNESTLRMRWPKYWSFSFSISPSNTQDWFPLWLTGLISLLSKGLSRIFSSITVWRHQFLALNLVYGPALISIHDCWKKTYLWLDGPLLAKWCLCCLIHCLGLHCFSSKEQASFNFTAAVTICSDFEVQENKTHHSSHFLPFYLPWSDGTRCHDLSFLKVEF